MSTEYLINEQQGCSTTNEISSTVHTNGHNDILYKPLIIQPPATSPQITNMLTTINHDNKNQISQPITTASVQTTET